MRNPNDVPGGDYWAEQSRFEKALEKVVKEACTNCSTQSPGWRFVEHTGEPYRCSVCNPEPEEKAKPGIIPEFHWNKLPGRAYVLIREADGKAMYRIHPNEVGWVAKIYRQVLNDDLGVYENSGYAMRAAEKAFKTAPENIRMQRQWREQHTRS